MKDISIIIPTLNEQDNITPLIRQIQETLDSTLLNYEIIIVDDNSSDNTREEARKFSDEVDIKIIRRQKEKGLSTAVIRGANESSAETVVIMDADLSHPPQKLPALVAPVLQGEQEMVIGSRYTEGGSTIGWPASRRVASRIASIPAQLLTSALDPLAGFFAIKRKTLLASGKKAAGFKIGLEVLANNKEMAVSEVPISFTDRSSGSSKMNSSVLYQYLMQLIRLTKKRVESPKTLHFLFLALMVGLGNLTLFTSINQIYQVTDFNSGFVLSYCGSFIAGFLLYKRKKGYPLPLRSFIRYLFFTILTLFLVNGIVLNTAFTNSVVFLSVLLFTTTLFWIVTVVLTEHSHFLQFNLVPIIVLYSCTLRILHSGQIELLREEAYYWQYAQHMAAGYLDHPPMVALLIKAGTWFFGDNEFGVRFGASICWLLTAFFSYKLTKNIFNEQTALKTLAIIAILPAYFATGFVITPDAPLIAAWSATLYFLYKAFFQDAYKAWYWAGLAIGLGLVSKYSMVFLGAGIVTYMVIDKKGRRWLFKPQPFIAAIIALLVFSPVIYWNYQNEWASFLFQSQRRVNDDPSFYTPALLAYILILLTPVGFWAVAKVTKRRVLKNEDKKYCLTMTLIPLAIVLFFSFTKEVKLNWTAPFWLALLPFIANITWSTINGAQTNIWPKTAAAIMITYGLIMQYSSTGIPLIPYKQGNFLSGWDDYIVQVERAAEEVREKTGAYPLIVGLDRYMIASGLSFYNSKNNCTIPPEQITGRHLFNRTSLMHEYWDKLPENKKQFLLVIDKNKNKFEKEKFPNDYFKISDIQTFQLSKNGKDAGSYYYAILKKSRFSVTEHQKR